MYTPYPAKPTAIRRNAVDRSFMPSPCADIEAFSAAQRLAEAPDGRRGGCAPLDEDGIDRARDLAPRAAGGRGHALQGPCGLALLRLQLLECVRASARLARHHL